jgi:hypothetical protein
MDAKGNLLAGLLVGWSVLELELLTAGKKDSVLAGVWAERMADVTAAMWAVELVASTAARSVDWTDRLWVD